jgi:putative aminopeptidase FrvX
MGCGQILTVWNAREEIGLRGNSDETQRDTPTITVDM